MSDLLKVRLESFKVGLETMPLDSGNFSIKFYSEGAILDINFGLGIA